MLLIVPRRYFCGGSFCFVLVFKIVCAVMCVFIVLVAEWPPIGKIAAHSAYDMFHGIVHDC